MKRRQFGTLAACFAAAPEIKAIPVVPSRNPLQVDSVMICQRGSQPVICGLGVECNHLDKPIEGFPGEWYRQAIEWPVNAPATDLANGFRELARVLKDPADPAWRIGEQELCGHTLSPLQNPARPAVVTVHNVLAPRKDFGMIQGLGVELRNHLHSENDPEGFYRTAYEAIQPTGADTLAYVLLRLADDISALVAATTPGHPLTG